MILHINGLGTTLIIPEEKKIILNELSVELGHGTFAEVCKASEKMVDLFQTVNKEFITPNILYAMEIPPVQGMYAVKLWALDTHLYNSFLYKKPYLFNVPYLKFINKKYEGKKDTMDMVNDIIVAFESAGYTIEQRALTKKGKPKKITNNQCDSFVYATRMFVKYYYENGIIDEVLAQIIEINDRFLAWSSSLWAK